MLHDVESENMRLKTENAAVTATLHHERERLLAYDNKIRRYEASLDALNRKLRDKDDYISLMERNIGEKQHMLNKKEQERELQRRKYHMIIGEEKGKLEQKFSEEKRKLEEKGRVEKEKLRLVTEIMNSEGLEAAPQPVSNLIQRFNSNCENSQPPGSERKTRTRVSLNLQSFNFETNIFLLF